MEYYDGVFGGTLTSNTFGEFGADAADADKITHAFLETESLALMASDTAPGMEHNPGNSISISLSGTDADELRGY